MMSLAPVSVHQGRHYYKRDNYYTASKDVENSAWFGLGAAELGLSGFVNAEQFDLLLTGVNPITKEPLAHDKGRNIEQRRAGIDLTFSAPKSVSLAALVGGDAQVEEAHRRAVERALRVAEERYSLTRTGGNQDRQREVAGNFIAAQFHHDTSRAKDPQLHTHCVVINTVKRDDGKWRSLANEGLYTNSKLLGLIYQNELAREVEALGYRIRPTAKGTFEIEGYSEEQLRSFSKRRQQLEELGAVNQQQAQSLVKVDRPTKGDEVPREMLMEGWQREARGYGIEHPLARERGLEPVRYIDHDELVKAGMRHATERDVSFRREDLERFTLETNLGRVDLAELNYQVGMATHRQEMISHAPGRFTTREALATEERMIAALNAGKEHFAPISVQIPERIRANEIGLTAGQKAALEVSLASSDQFLAWQGVAGAGKTFAMNELRMVAEAQGVNVRGFAPSAEAAKVLETESKISAQTVAGLLAKSGTGVDHQGRELWIVDEAGLLAARDAARLMEQAADQGARVIFVGDTRQLSGVEAGNPFKLLQQSGIITAHLTESRRQKTEVLKEVAAQMGQGEVRAGLSLLEKDIVEFTRESTRIRHVAKQYLALDDSERSSTLVLAGTNRERALLTEAIREGLRAEGSLGDSVNVKTLHAKDLTSEERRAAAKIESGDVLIFHKEYRQLGIAKGEQLEVVGADLSWQMLHVRRQNGSEFALTPQRAASFQVYEVRDTGLAAGDRIRWTRNGLGLRNGQDLTVARIEGGQIVLAAKDGRELQRPENERLHLDHNYVSTVYASQGKTSERVIISADKTFGREAMYVAISRAKSSVTLYTQDKQRMCQLAETSRAKVSAQELVSDISKAPSLQKSPDLAQERQQRMSRGLSR